MSKASFTKDVYAAALADNAAYDKARDQNAFFAVSASTEHDAEVEADRHDDETHPVETELAADFSDEDYDAAHESNALGDMFPLDTAIADEIATELAAVQEPEAETPTEEPVQDQPAAEVPNATLSFAEVLSTIPDSEAEVMAFKVAAAFDERSEFERTKDPTNENIQRTLKGARANMITKAAAAVMIATNTDPNFIVRSLHQGSGYNVYAIQKVADIVRGLTDGACASNKINLAVMRTLFRFRASGDVFTGEIAKSCASRGIKPKVKLIAELVSHTVAPSTASTQASSTMQALSTLGIVKADGPGRSPVYKLTDHPAVAELEKRIAA